MKKYLTILILAIAFASYAENIEKKPNNEFGGESIVITYNEKDKMYMQVIKKTELYNAKKQIMKIEYFNNEKIVKQTGILQQNEYYNDKKVVFKYELYFSQEYVIESNINKVIENVDANDQITSIEYYSNNQLVDKESKDFHNYPFKKMSINGNIIKNNYKEIKDSGSNKNCIVIEGKTTRGKAIVKYQNIVQTLSNEELKNIEDVGRAFTDKNYLEFLKKNYKSKILVEEENVKYWICIQEPLIQYLKNNQRMVVWYYFLGGFNGEPLFITTGFSDLK